MPEYGYSITKGQRIYDDPDAVQKWLSNKPDDYRGFEKHRGIPQDKSGGQLGWYWGLLAPEVSKAMIALGWTVTKKFVINGKVHEKEYPWDGNGNDKLYTDTHKFLKDNGARIGGVGEYVTLSKQDKEECRKFLENVLWICEHWLDMNMKELEAKRPKQQQDIPLDTR
jgi:hypothetical protein